MKKLIVIGSLPVIFFLCIQGYWFSKAYDASATQFDHSVSVALYTVADTISENATVKKKSSNYFYVTTNSRLSSEAVDTMIQKELAARNIHLDYEIGVYNAEDDSLVHGKYVSDTLSGPKEFSDEKDDFNKNFAVLFPSRNIYLFNQMDLWIFATLVLVVISWSSIHLRTSLKASSKLSSRNHNQIRLGNSCLDFHNQNLMVNKTSYSLTYKENKILKLFFENPNQVIERREFLEKVWEQDGFFVARSMDVFISKIRKYLTKDQTVKIENLRSIGYRLRVSK